MFSRRHSSASYPTQLHRRNVCVHMRSHNSIDTIISSYTASLMVSARPVHGPSEGGVEDEAFLQVTKYLGVVAVKLPRSQADSALHRRTRGINHRRHHLTKGSTSRIGSQLYCRRMRRTVRLQTHPPCVPASVAESTRRTPRSRVPSSLTSQCRAGLTDRPSVCFPPQDEVHFLCSLCFRP